MSRPLKCALLMAVCVLGGLLFVRPAAAQAWPEIPMPGDVSAFAVGEQMTANGLPMRVRGFFARGRDVAALAEWFRTSLGQPLAEQKLGNKLILGRAQGGYYLTVQLENVGATDSKGLLAVTDIRGMNLERDRYQETSRRWIDRWPAGSQLLTRMNAQDGDKFSSYAVVRNGHSPELNRDALTAFMEQDGLTLERESLADSRALQRHSDRAATGKAYFFRGEASEGMATITSDTSGHTTIVLNTTRRMQAWKQ